MPKDRKLNAQIKQEKVLQEEVKTRIEEQEEFLAPDEGGFIELEGERERTVKVTQKELKADL